MNDIKNVHSVYSQSLTFNQFCILHHESLVSTLSKLPCPTCLNNLKSSGVPIFPEQMKDITMCHHADRNIAFSTKIMMKCPHGHITDLGEGPKNMERTYSDATKTTKQVKNITHDINILMALSSIVNGTGGTELARIASLLGLPSSVCVNRNANTISKRYLHKAIVSVAEEIILESLLKEARACALDQLSTEKFNFLWPSYEKTIKGNFSELSTEHQEALKSNPIKLAGSVDMGWQKRSSGRKYDSPSGHMFLVGSETGEIISYTCMSLNCRQCLINKKNRKLNKPEKEHECFKNFDGHSKAMEATSARKLITEICQNSHGVLYMDYICADDDSTMKKYCTHEGGLPDDVPQPIFLADPTHRVKVIAKYLYALGYLPLYQSLVTVADCNRLKVNFSYFVKRMRQKKGVSPEWMSKKAMCVIDHMFDDHTLCTPDFCWKKKHQEEFIEKKIAELRKSGELPPYMEEILEDENNLLDYMERNPHSPPQAETNDQGKKSEDFINIQNADPKHSTGSTRSSPHQQYIDFITNLQKEAKLELEEETARLLKEMESNSSGNQELEHLPRKLLRMCKGYYRCKHNDFKIYNDIKKKFLPHITPIKMSELIHHLNTQKNESMNTLVSYHLPKNRNYSRSNEIFTRLAYIVGINNVGRKEMIRRILKACGITTKNRSLMKHLGIEDSYKKRKKEREQCQQVKSRRIRDRIDKSRADSVKAVKAKNEGAFYHSSTSKLRSKAGSNNTEKSQTCVFTEIGCPNNPPHAGYGSKACMFCSLYKKYQAECPKNQKGKKEYIKNKVFSHVETERIRAQRREQRSATDGNNEVTNDPFLITGNGRKSKTKLPDSNSFMDLPPATIGNPRLSIRVVTENTENDINVLSPDTYTAEDFNTCESDSDHYNDDNDRSCYYDPANHSDLV